MTMRAWDTDSVTSVFTASHPGAIAAATASHIQTRTPKRPFQRPSQQPDKACAPPVMPKRKLLDTKNGKTPNTSTTRTSTKDDMIEDMATRKPQRQSRSPPTQQRTKSSATRHEEDDAPRRLEPKLIPPLRSYESIKNTTGVVLVTSQPRVDRYRSLMTVQSAFSPLPTPYVHTARGKRQQDDRQSLAKTDSLVSFAHSEASVETPKLDNTSRKAPDMPYPYSRVS